MVLRAVGRSDQRVARRIVAAIDSLAEDPRPAAAVRLRGAERPLYRIRAGDHRVIYSVDDTVVTVEVLRIGHRRDIYEQFFR